MRSCRPRSSTHAWSGAWQDDPVAARSGFCSGLPRGRLGEPDDIKGLAVLLASDASSWITGALIPMDGGNLAMNAGGGLLAPIMERHGLGR